MAGYRLPSGGDWIDRNRPIPFTFDGKSYVGFEGDSLASALLASGVEVVARSFKYHRPRGLLAAGREEPNAIVDVTLNDVTTPNLRATCVPLGRGLRARSVNAWPSAAHDVMAINDRISRFIPAGFYYKTFMWPDWRHFEPAIRRAAGLGIAPDAPDPDRYEHRHAHVDVLIVGGGPAGLAAAAALAGSDRDVLLVEDHSICSKGCSLPDARISQLDGGVWMDDRIQVIKAASNITLLPNTLAIGFHDHNLVSLVERCGGAPHGAEAGPRERLWKVRAKAIILATGAFERPLLFGNNDRSGVMLASAGLTYALRHGVATGRQCVIVTNNNTAYAAAFGLASLGLRIAALVDVRANPPSDLIEKLSSNGVECIPGAIVKRALGRHAVSAVEVVNAQTSGGSDGRLISCDAVLMSGGWSPNLHLFCQAGGELAFDQQLSCFLPAEEKSDFYTIGACAGIFDIEAAIEHAQLVSLGVLSGAGTHVDRMRFLERSRSSLDTEPCWRWALTDSGTRAWVDFQNDVTVKDIEIALRENYRSVEHVKRYTTLGMATDQGKTSNVNAIGLMAEISNLTPEEVGVTRFRPPYEPTTIGAFAGPRVAENLTPLKNLSADARHCARGAVMREYGGWRRPAFYPKSGESEDAAIQREMLCVRNQVGIFDASPLGKIEITGPDAAELLDRLYANNILSLKAGRCRYALMLTEHGVVFDDGVISRIDESRFLVGSTSAHADAVYAVIEEWRQCEWPDLKVVAKNVTMDWAVITIAGPNSRTLLDRFNFDVDLKAAAFPHMTMQECSFEGLACRLHRVSFTGELSFELSIPWNYSSSVFEALIETGRDLGASPFGVEALSVLRLEKGFPLIGVDTDGATMLRDIGFGGVLDASCRDFAGKRSSQRAAAVGDGRRQLVGLEAINDTAPLPVGAHIVSLDQNAQPASNGWITSSAWSPTLGRPVALGLVRNGARRLGDEVIVWDAGDKRRARIAPVCALDPEGRRQHV